MLLSGLVVAAPARAEEPLWGEIASTLGKGFVNVTTNGLFRSYKPYRHHGGPVFLTIEQTEAAATVEYGLLPDLDLHLKIPYISENIQERFEGESVDNPMSSLGEMQLGSKWRFWQAINAGHKDELSLVTHLKLPTGRDDLRDRNGLVITPHLQPNSGNLGGSVGLAANRHMPMGGFWLSGMVNAETASPRFHRGTSLELHGSAGRRARRLTQINQMDWMGILGLHYHRMWRDQEFERTLRDSGGSVLSAEVSLLGSKRNVAARLGVMFPVSTHLGLSHAPPRQEIQASIRGSF
jgi:hypothetical protein